MLVCSLRALQQKRDFKDQRSRWNHAMNPGEGFVASAYSCPSNLIHFYYLCQAVLKYHTMQMMNSSPGVFSCWQVTVWNFYLFCCFWLLALYCVCFLRIFCSKYVQLLITGCTKKKKSNWWGQEDWTKCWPPDFNQAAQNLHLLLYAVARQKMSS